MFYYKIRAWFMDNFTCPLCGKFSFKGQVHLRCHYREQAWADSFGGYR